MPGVLSSNSGSHHHRATTKTTHKAYKPRFTSKNALRDRSKGRVESAERGHRKTPHQQVMSKFDKKNQAKQRRLARQETHDRARSIFNGKDGAARVVAVVPLSSDIDASVAIEKLNASLEIGHQPHMPKDCFTVDRFKQKLHYVPVARDISAAMDACRVADYVLCLLSAKEEVDELGELMLKSIETQGVSNIYTAATDLNTVEPPKKRPQILASLKSFICHFFADQQKVFSLDSTQECQNVVRSLCTSTPKGIRWRSDRSWMLVEEMTTNGKAKSGDTCDLTLVGVVRGRNLKADRLVRLNDMTDVQISHITAAPRSRPHGDGQMTVDEEPAETLDAATDDRDNLDELAPEDVVVMDGEEGDLVSMAPTERKSVLLDDEIEATVPVDDEAEETQQPKRVPKGTSKYQAAWYIGDEADYDSDFESENGDEESAPAGREVDMDAAPDLVPAGPSAHADAMDGVSTVGGDHDDAEEQGDLEAYRSAKRSARAADDDRQFPDEIELPPNVIARERLARYRGLRSARTSPWATVDDKPYEPADWARLLDIADARGARARFTNEALAGGVPAGRRVAVHLSNVPADVASAAEARLMQTPAGGPPCTLFSLLRHEHKCTAMHAALSIPRDFPRALRNKEEIIAQVGPRRLAIRATFTTPGATPNDVHKVARWVWPGDSVVVSWTGPVAWGALPVVFFAAAEAPKDDASESEPALPVEQRPLALLGAGTLMHPSTGRILAKRAVLTGQPYALHARQTHVRHMFFNTADVAYFSALPLWSTRGKRGAFKESLGTHGHFKAAFDGRLNAQEAVAVSLWKRVWPRPARAIGAVPAVLEAPDEEMQL